ncbi:GNAT family N-acetyltransferase [Stappia stellulata]|uniref:GNAT family N-acetyltransferase n=1 Tax=Stappia stellulata TaxID=71235 RepID=UPI0004154A64|nr:GNAT family N-acetyltransferase [Stappia stellulata]
MTLQNVPLSESQEPFAAEVQIVPATDADIPAAVALLSGNAVGSRVGVETGDPEPYRAALRRMQAGGATTLFVARPEGAEPGVIAGMFELTVLTGLSYVGQPRAKLESVHVAPDWQRRGIGRTMMAFAEARARALGCVLLQLSSNKERAGAHRFYTALGYEASHIGFKRML